MKALSLKKSAMMLLLLAISPLATATEEPKEEPKAEPKAEPKEEQSILEILNEFITPGGTYQGPP